VTGRPAFPIIVAASLIAGCSSANADYELLLPRATERIDPRLPVGQPVNDRPATPALVQRLESLVAQARSGEAGFGAAIAAARVAAQSAGPRESESWIVAQEALSAAVKAREPAATALGAIDSLGAEMLMTQGGLAPADLDAVQRAAETVGAIDRRQAEAIDEIQARLGS
jgi:hypothetical protein